MIASSEKLLELRKQLNACNNALEDAVDEWAAAQSGLDGAMNLDSEELKISALDRAESARRVYGESVERRNSAYHAFRDAQLGPGDAN